MANITYYMQENCGGALRTYTSDQEDIAANGVVMSCKVNTSTATVFQVVKFKGESAQLAVGGYRTAARFLKA